MTSLICVTHLCFGDWLLFGRLPRAAYRCGPKYICDHGRRADRPPLARAPLARCLALDAAATLSPHHCRPLATDFCPKMDSLHHLPSWTLKSGGVSFASLQEEAVAMDTTTMASTTRALATPATSSCSAAATATMAADSLTSPPPTQHQLLHLTSSAAVTSSTTPSPSCSSGQGKEAKTLKRKLFTSSAGMTSPSDDEGWWLILAKPVQFILFSYEIAYEVFFVKMSS